jgi:hypothetical protein
MPLDITLDYFDFSRFDGGFWHADDRLSLSVQDGPITALRLAIRYPVNMPSANTPMRIGMGGKIVLSSDKVSATLRANKFIHC